MKMTFQENKIFRRKAVDDPYKNVAAIAGHLRSEILLKEVSLPCQGVYVMQNFKVEPVFKKKKKTFLEGKKSAGPIDVYHGCKDWSHKNCKKKYYFPTNQNSIFLGVITNTMPDNLKTKDKNRDMLFLQ